MTIIFFARRFYPLIGGVEKHVLEISNRLILKGHKVIVVTEKADNLPSFEVMKSTGLEIYRLNVGHENKNKKFQIWSELWKIKDIIKKADIIHCHDVFFWYLPFRFYYPNKPVYTTFHGYESYPIKGSAIKMRKMSEKLSWGNICIGDFIIKWYGTKPTYISYGAVENPPYKQNDKTFKKESALFIGRLDDQTGILTYVKSIEKIRKSLPKFIMTAIGDGVYRKKITNKINTLGFKDNPEKYLPKFHFAFVSRYLAILEAFAAKRLVFATYDNPVKEDYLKMAPFAEYMVIAETAEQLSEKIQYYLENPQKETKLINEAYKWVQKQSWEEMVNLYLALWKNKN